MPRQSLRSIGRRTKRSTEGGDGRALRAHSLSFRDDMRTPDTLGDRLATFRLSQLNGRAAKTRGAPQDMADGSQENQELITALHLFTTSNMCELVGITLLAYDHLLTLSGEIRFVWDRKFSGATVIFVLNRYVNLFSKIVLPISTFWWPNQTDKVLGSSIALDSLTESDVDVVAVQLQLY
ncbi:hypothetical protein NUW54_g9908 [Trametes sanguinea]|uniref:Uncharacterized protein n=1 Tax=Trametes sanguinea TaxID=158606 RepID=A0ACC1P4F0_9APHY|nr:hypothetical protein NUW54_g9908 [Trametes sanguinea]